MNKHEEKQLKDTIENQQKVIDMLSNQKIVKGLMSSLDDVKKGNFIRMTNY
jgi:hypothetical protein